MAGSGRMPLRMFYLALCMPGSPTARVPPPTARKASKTCACSSVLVSLTGEPGGDERHDHRSCCHAWPTATNTFAALRLLRMSDHAEDAEILTLRHHRDQGHGDRGPGRVVARRSQPAPHAVPLARGPHRGPTRPRHAVACLPAAIRHGAHLPAAEGGTRLDRRSRAHPRAGPALDMDRRRRLHPTPPGAASHACRRHRSRGVPGSATSPGFKSAGSTPSSLGCNASRRIPLPS